MARHRDVVRAERLMSRAGLWATTHVALELPLDAHGLSELIRANGRLRITPDYDVFAYLCEGYLSQQNAEGWVRFTLRDLGTAIHRGRAPDRKERAELRDSLARLLSIKLDIIGYGARERQLNPRKYSQDNLFDRLESELDYVADARDIGALRGSTFEVQLPPWLRDELDRGSIARIHWPTLLKFNRNQQLAKRLFVYLSAERWKNDGEGREAVWVGVGDRLFTALGMNYAEATKSRLHLRRAATTVAGLDNRMVSVEVRTVRPGRPRRVGHYQLHAVRLDKEALKARGDLLLPLDPKTERDRRRVARAIRTALGQQHAATMRTAFGEMDAD